MPVQVGGEGWGERGWERKCAHHRRTGLQKERWRWHGTTWLPRWEGLSPPMPATSRAESAWAPLPPVHCQPFLAAPHPAWPAAGSPGPARVPSLGSPYCVPTSCPSPFLDVREAYWMPPLGSTDTRRAPHSFLSLFGFPVLCPLLPSPPCPAQDLAGTEINVG